MKKLTITCALLALAGATYAQRGPNPTNDNGEKINRKNIEEPRWQENKFTGSEMTVDDKVITFSDLPEMPKPIWAVITNPEGEFIKQAKVNTQYNAMDIGKLRKGMYFVTLVYKNKSQKAFVLKLGV